MNQLTNAAILTNEGKRAMPLGINTKSRTAFVERPTNPIIARFYLQSVARDLMPEERVATCLRLPIPHADIEIYHAEKSNSAHYVGLTVCGSVWHCPVCAAKIAQRRLLELQTAIANWRGQTAMVTFTISHHNRESAGDVLRKLLANYQEFWRGRAIQQIKDDIGYIGKVRSLEVTYGNNGWHAHVHTLLFFGESKLAPRIVELSFKERWQTTVIRRGDYASIEHGCNVKTTDDFIADYMQKFDRLPRSKWTEAHEIAHSHKKNGTSGGATPMQLLDAAGNGNRLAADLWREYAAAFKGKRQLSWSPGLKDLLHVGPEKDDYEIATETDQTAILLATLTRGQWGIVLANDLRGELLTIAAAGNKETLLAYLADVGIFA